MTKVRFRPLFGQVLAVITALIALGAVAGFVVTGDLAGLARYVWPVLLVALLAWALFWRPELVVEEHGVTVVNVLRTFVLPWPAIERVETRWSVKLHTVVGAVPVWASPAPGRHAATRVTREDFRGVAESAYGDRGSLRPADALTTESGAAAQVLRQRWEQLRDAGLLDRGVEEGSVRVTWHWATIAAFVALVAASAIGSLV